MTEKELKKHIYELTYALDTYSASKNYDALRRTHYNNIAWLHSMGWEMSITKYGLSISGS